MNLPYFTDEEIKEYLVNKGYIFEDIQSYHTINRYHDKQDIIDTIVKIVYIPGERPHSDLLQFEDSFILKNYGYKAVFEKLMNEKLKNILLH